MDVFDILLQIAVMTSALVFYLIFVRATPKMQDLYIRPGWNYPLKIICARYAVRQWKAKKRKPVLAEEPREDLAEGFDSLSIRATAPDGTVVLLVWRKLCGGQPQAEITVHVQLTDGTSYKLPRKPDTLVGAWNEAGWSAGGLKAEVLEPGRRLRVLFNGILTREDTDTAHHVRMNFIWSNASKPMFHPEDWSEELAAHAIALEPWRDGNWMYLLDRWEDGGWLQWGSLQGCFQVEGAKGAPSTQTWLRARGTRKRHWAPHSYLGLRRSVSLMVMARDGTGLHLRVDSYRRTLTQVVTGSVRLSNGKMEAITASDLDLSQFCEVGQLLPKVYSIRISTKSKGLKVVLFNLEKDKNGELYSGIPYQQQIQYREVHAEINGDPARGILELGYEPKHVREPLVRVSGPQRLKFSSLSEVPEVAICASFDAPAAFCPQLVGCKGASLALLSSIQQDEEYIVPSGFCITTLGFELFLKENPEIQSAITELHTANENYDEVLFKEKCERVQELFDKTQMDESLEEVILKYVGELRRKFVRIKTKDLRFAVRSSALREDSEAISAAGQNDTALGCVSDEDVVRAVLKCWSSLFTFTSVQNRRQNGQPCLVGIGIVIQTLVWPRVAGVMLSTHPRSGDPSKIVITANYGLGQSVVSGTVEPDTFVVARRNESYQLTIVSTELGSKKQLIMPGETGVTLLNVPEDMRSSACLTSTEVLKLARVCTFQEDFWGSARDIEWAIDQDNIYLLQARPIKNLDSWSEEELLHELDTPVMSDEELLTFANTGEVVPNSISPMTAVLVLEPLMTTSMASSQEVPLYLTHNRLTINLYQTIYRIMPSKVNMFIRMLDIVLHGHTVAKDRIHGIATHRNVTTLKDRIFMLWYTLKMFYNAKSHVKTAVSCVKDMTIDKTMNEDILETLNDIEKSKEELTLVSSSHSGVTIAASVAQIIAMATLLEGGPELTPEHCCDLSIISCCGNTVSADLPVSIAELANKLTESGKAEEFRAVHPREGMLWLRKNLPSLHMDILLFLDKHGYRAAMELELSTKPWSIDREGLMKVLQTIQTPHCMNQTVKTTKEIISALVTPKRALTKILLRWVLPMCQKKVAQREATKEQMALAVHKVRVELRRLAKLMVKAWLLPDVELVFYFTPYELRRLIKTRDSALLRKAVQRRWYFPKWDKLQFNELQEGWPSPVRRTRQVVTAVDTRLTGTPMCVGNFIARACVIHDLSEIDQLQQGDILVTHCTDIGWSPYFTMLAGVATELGGLISHGAVIARECGLPCVVGVTGATNYFKTGDLIRLCGNTGLLEKVSVDG